MATQAEARAERKGMTAAERRQAELDRGSERLAELKSILPKHMTEATTAQEKAHKERAEQWKKEEEDSLKERTSVLSLADKAVADRAGAEVIDQAQTMLEAVQHMEDREFKIMTLEHEQMVEQELPRDGDATNATVAQVEFQAVNQPTPLANAIEGQDTENKPLNTSGMEERFLSQDRIPVPADRHVPKTQEQASKLSKPKVPPAKKVVKADNTKDAVEVFNAADDDVLA